MLKKFLLILSIVALFFTVVPPIPVHAQAQSWSGCIDPNTGVATLQCLSIVFGNIVTAALEFVGAVAVILLVYAGIRFVTSGGDPKQVQSAQKIITYALIGLVIILCS